MRWKTSWSSLLLVVAACATAPDWVRDGTSREAMEADLLACDAAARAVPTVPRPRDRLGVAHPDLPDADHQLDLAQRVERCMRGRGYIFERARRLLM
jgi:hypothetical protein